jgi:hypothetical protein
MFEIRADKKRNRISLNITQAGRDELKTGYRLLEKTYLKMKSNFTLLIDLGDDKPLIEKHGNRVRHSQKRAWEAGIGKVVVVINASYLEKFKSDIKDSLDPDQPVTYAVSILDAEKILDEYEIGTAGGSGGPTKDRYRIIDSDGWQDEVQFSSFNKALSRLGHIRHAGRKDAIIVNAS